MKALSIIQPWATLLMAGRKRFETRSYSVHHRGPVLILASKKNEPYARMCQMEPFRSVLAELGYTAADQLPRGYLLGVADLSAVVGTDTYGEMPHLVDKTELAFGDWTPGRWAWRFMHHAALQTPIPAIGKQGLFDFPDDQVPEQFRHPMARS